MSGADEIKKGRYNEEYHETPRGGSRCGVVLLCLRRKTPAPSP
jgi:hypothetical protein